MFKHLIGNVAEFVTTPDGSYLVMGGSALSPKDHVLGPSLRTGISVPADAAYSDVGFRLAFDAGGDQRTPAERILAVLTARDWMLFVRTEN